jgi:hypothetical protein
MIPKNKRQTTLLLLAGTVASLLFQTTTMGAVIFTESFGTVTGTTVIATHETANGFDNDGFTFLGTGDIRNATPSDKYIGASGEANAYLTSTGTPTIVISGISTIGYTAGTVGISFGAYKSAIASTMSTLLLAYSTDATNWTPITTLAEPTGTGTSIWRSISIQNTNIPISSTLSLRWKNENLDTTYYRIDDVVLTALPEPSIAVLSALGLLGFLRRRR